MHLNFQIEFSPAPEYLLQYFFFGIITNNLFMGARIYVHTFMCSFMCVSLKSPSNALPQRISSTLLWWQCLPLPWTPPARLPWPVRQTQESTSLCYLVLGFQQRTTTLTIFLCRFWCSNAVPLTFKVSALLTDSFLQPKSQPPLRKSKWAWQDFTLV